MVIVDECHHGASHVFENVLRQINSKYIYDVSANDKRIEKQSINHYVYPRFTRIMALGDSKNDLNSAYAFIFKNENRNYMIISDIKKCIKENRTPIVLTRNKEHAKLLYESLKKNVLDYTYLIYGDHTFYRKIGFDVITDIGDNKQNVNHIYNYRDYLEVFRQDIHESNKRIIISSLQLNEKKVLSFIELIKDRQEKGVSIIVFTKQTDDPYTTSLIDLLYYNGVFVEIYPDLDSYFAVIDQEIVWHGGINLFGKSNIYDSLMRVKSTTIAEELIFSPTEIKDCDS